VVSESGHHEGLERAASNPLFFSITKCLVQRNVDAMLCLDLRAPWTSLVAAGLEW
jgi:hypothetical protein